MENLLLKMEIGFIADIGAIFITTPKHIADKLKLEVRGKRRLKITYGDVVEYSVSETYIIK